MAEVEEAATNYINGVLDGDRMQALVDLMAISGERIQAKFWKIVDAEFEKIGYVWHASNFKN